MYLTGLQIDLTTKKTFPNFSIYYIYSCTTLSKTKENKKKHIVRTQNNIKHYLDAAHKKPCYKFFHQLDLQHRRVLHFVVLENHKAWPWSEILHIVWNIFSILSTPPTVRRLEHRTYYVTEDLPSHFPTDSGLIPYPVLYPFTKGWHPHPVSGGIRHIVHVIQPGAVDSPPL